VSAVERISPLLPSYLTDATREKLEAALKDFYSNGRITQDPFSIHKNEFFLQGDILNNVPFPYWHENQFRTYGNARCIILSNTCDIDVQNTRDIPLDCILAPVLSVEKYEDLLERSGISPEKIKQFSNNLRKYKITNLFHLPIDDKGQYAPDGKGYLVQLDKAFSLPRTVLDINQHLKSLNQFFSYLFTFQLSVNLCRFHDKVDREENICY